MNLLSQHISVIQFDNAGAHEDAIAGRQHAWSHNQPSCVILADVYRALTACSRTPEHHKHYARASVRLMDCMTSPLQLDGFTTGSNEHKCPHNGKDSGTGEKLNRITPSGRRLTKHKLPEFWGSDRGRQDRPRISPGSAQDRPRIAPGSPRIGPGLPGRAAHSQVNAGLRQAVNVRAGIVAIGIGVQLKVTMGKN
jgi:hypothetical protein